MTAPSSPTQESSSGGLPGRLRVAVVSTLLVGVVLVAYGAFVAAHWLFETPDEPVNAALLVLFALAWGVGILTCARALSRRRRWAVAPVLTSALLLVAVGWLLAGGREAEAAVGWAVLALGVVCLVSTLAAGRYLD